jgi:serralysin
LAAIASVTPSSNAYINALLSNYKWASGSLTYSFPSSYTYYESGYGSNEPLRNFEGLNATQQGAVRAAFANFAAVANVTFTELTGASAANATLRLAMSDAPGTAWAYMPHTAAEGGDGWFNNASGVYDNPHKGNYAYTTFLHEIGHALGLAHPHENGMPADGDSMELSVMSYRGYAGAPLTGYTNESWGYAQTLMMYDIAAMQHLYGANFSSNIGNTTYSWSSTTGEMFVDGVGQGAAGGNRIFQTLWDGGGVDTYDFANYATSLNVDLRPGQWTTLSDTQLANLHYTGSQRADGNIANALQYNGDARSLIENAVGGSGNDSITGNLAANRLVGNGGSDRLSGGGGDDLLTGGQGDDRIEGGQGVDTAFWSGFFADYEITRNSAGELCFSDSFSFRDGFDTVVDVENFSFADRQVTLSGLFGINVKDAQLLQTEFTTNDGWLDFDRVPRYLADINGDGMADIAGFADDGVHVSLNDGTGTFAPSTFVLPTFGAVAGGWSSEDHYPRHLADVTGDGRADIIGFGDNGVYVAKANASGSFEAASLKLGNFGVVAGGWSTDDRNPREMADVNGDGLADIVGFGDNAVYVALAQADGSFGRMGVALAGFGAVAGGWTSNDKYPRRLADINGDDRADIVAFGDNAVFVALGNADGTFSARAQTITTFGYIAGGWTSNDQFPRQLGDVNGDGCADIIGFGEIGAYVALADGRGSFSSTVLALEDFGTRDGWWSNQVFNKQVVDIDGDNRAEVIGFGDVGVFASDLWWL